METIIKISKQKSPFYQLSLSNGEELAVSEDLLVKYRLLKGQELSTDVIAEIKKASFYDYGLQKALNYLSYQLRTEKEMQDYLKEQGLASQDSQKVIERLHELALLDDKVYGESYIRTQVRLSDKGPKVLAQQLKKKGLSNEVIEQAMVNYSLTQQVENALKLLNKVSRRVTKKSKKEATQKFKLALIQKGYSQEAISLVLEEFQWEPDLETERENLEIQGDKIWHKHRDLPFSKRKMKTQQKLYQKGFNLDDIHHYLDGKEQLDE